MDIEPNIFQSFKSKSIDRVDILQSTTDESNFYKLNDSTPKDVILQTVLQKAVEFLLLNLQDSYTWSDFDTNRSGESTSWITAYVLSQVGSVLPPMLVQTILQELESHGVAGEWGFSPRTPPDCDSTLHVLDVFSRFDPHNDTVQEILESIFSYKSSNGAFRTYKDVGLLSSYRNDHSTSFNGWTADHACVTAYAAQVLSHPVFVSHHSIVDQALYYLEKQQNDDGFWISYWWRNKYFTTAKVLPLFTANPSFKKGTQAALSYILDTAHPEGYWDNGYDGGIPCCLSTAICIGALLKAQIKKSVVTKQLLWLIDQQRADGSWPALPSLRIPPPDILHPELFDTWRIGGKGVGSCSPDGNRIYTTATVAGVLSTYLHNP